MGLCDSDVGVVEVLGQHLPFRAVVKAQVSDFVVNEVAGDGSVVQLTSTALPAGAVGAPEAKEEDANLPESEEEWTAVYAALDEQVGSGGCGISTLIREYIASLSAIARDNGAQTNSDNPASAQKALILPPLEEKDARRAVHAWVKSTLPSFITDTITSDAGKGCIRLRQRESCRPWKRRRTDGQRDRDAPQEANEDATRENTYDPRNVKGKGPVRGRDQNYVSPRTYVQFVLWKSGRDTVGALDDIAKRLRLNPNDISHAGTKDKRGITTQRVRIRGLPLQRLAYLNKTYLNYRGRQQMVLGNFEVLSGIRNKALALGDLAGNRFTLALRELDMRDDSARSNVTRAVESLREHGFINYFGLQRFGSGTFSTHRVGYSLLRGDYADICRKLMTPVVIKEVAEGRGVLREDRRKSDEALRGFAAGTVSAKELVSSLPFWMSVERNLATVFARMEDLGEPRDDKKAFESLPRGLRSMYGHAVQSYLWNLMATARVRQSQAPHAITGDLVLSDEHSRAIQLSHTTAVRVVTAEEEAARAISIERVLLPVIGSKVPVPSGPVGLVAQSALEEQKLDLQNLPVDCNLAGTYRWLVAKPKDLTFRIVSYKDREERLLPSTVADVLKAGRSAVRSIAQNDEPGLSTEKPTANPSEGKQGSGTIARQEDPDTDCFFALVLSFTLGTSEYATMLLRELTGQESSAENQKALAELSDAQLKTPLKRNLDTTAAGAREIPAVTADETVVRSPASEQNAS
jgi:tRNA pseudouridine13 synthase